MTTPESEIPHIPLYQSAVNALEKIAQPLFRWGMKLPEQSPGANAAFDNWFVLRSLATRIKINHSLTLTPRERVSLGHAMAMVHDLAHDRDI